MAALPDLPDIQQRVGVTVKIVATLPWVWEHHCGHLNKGAYCNGAVCMGCRYDTKPDEIQRYLLLDPEIQ